MIGTVLSKLEIDVMQVNELLEASDLAFKHKLPALVIHPNLSQEALIARIRVKGRYKIIIPLDWPKGENYGNIKFRGVNKSALECDGFEIMLTPNKTENETKNEASVLSDFIRSYLGEFVETRFVLGNLSKEKADITKMCKGLIPIRNPALIRSDTLLKIQQAKSNVDTHTEFQEAAYASGLNCPIKLSGNMNNLKSIATAPPAYRYAVNVMQAKTIIREYTQQPSELREILADK
jgi:hypothetical protein